MTDDHRDAAALWYRTSAKNAVIFALIFLAAPLPTLMFIKWAFHLSAIWYLILIPWSFFGAVIVVRPRWYVRVEKALKEKNQRDMHRFDKWTPPGFP